MKRFFKFALVAFAAAAVAVACQKPAEEQKPEEKPGPGPETEEVVPVEGDSEWSLIGALLGKSWDTDWVAAKSGDIYVVKNVKLATADQFKFRKNKDWGENRGAEGDVEPTVLTAGTPVYVCNNGKNLSASADGVYDIYYNAAVEQIAIVAKDGTPTWGPKKEDKPEPEGIIKIDGDFSDWADIEAVSKGNHKEFKVALDDNYIYFFTWRIPGTEADGYSQMWGHASEGWIYVALDLDKDPTTGTDLWGNGPYEFVGYHFPFGGSAASPEIRENPGANTGCAPSTATVANIYCKGVVSEDGAKIEYRIPRADLPEIPSTPFIVYSWGSLGLDKVEYHVGEAQPVEEYVHDYTPSAEYLAETNLWKAVDAACPDIYFYHCSGGVDNWDGADTHVTSMEDVPFATFEQSTYALSYEGLTNAQWMNQFFLFPKAENAIPVAAGDKLKFKATVYSDQAHPHAFFKLVTYNAAKPDKPEGGVLWEFGYQPITAGEPLVIENADIVVADGVSAENVVLVFDFGGNPENNKIYIKDIILEKVVPEAGNSVSEIIALADNTEVTTKASLVVAKCNRGVIISDGEKNIYAYNSAGVATEVGDMVVISGTKKVYNGVPEIDGAAVVEVKSSNNTVDYPAAKDITSSVESYSAAEAEFIVLEGTLAKSGNYYNLTIDGVDSNTKQGSIQYPVDALNADSYDGKKIDVVGYFNGLSGGGKYVNIITVKIQEAFDPSSVSITIDGDMSDWASVPGAEPASVYKAFKVWNDADNFYFYVATDPGSRLWSGGAYLYLYFDWDNDLTTGEYSGTTGMGSNKYEAYTYMFIFENNQISAPTSDSVAKGLTLDNIQLAGSDSTAEVCEIEIAIPRADFAQQVTAGTVIGVNSYRSKDGGNVNFPGYVVK